MFNFVSSYGGVSLALMNSGNRQPVCCTFQIRAGSALLGCKYVNLASNVRKQEDGIFPRIVLCHYISISEIPNQNTLSRIEHL